MKKLISFSFLLLLIVSVGCKCTSKATSVKEGIISTGWELSSLEGNKATTTEFPNGLPNAVFGADGRVSGHGGCNHYGGSYTLDNDGKLTLSQLISTKMFCQGVNEDAYIRTFSKADKAKIEEGNLVLYFGNEKALVFVPKKLK